MAHQVSAGSSQGEIRRRFKVLARLLHPDKCALPQAHAAFQRLHFAFQNLTSAAAATTMH
jgi:DnaJ-class molecular chaperone